MPASPILDSHVHLWDPNHFRIPWLDNIPLLNRAYGFDEYFAATEGYQVDGFVYLQVEVSPHLALLEARELHDLALWDARLQAIVPWAPLEDGEQARVYLDELVKISPKIKGVRRITQDEPDPEFCLRPRYIAATRLLPEYGLTSDLCCNFRQLGPTVELVRQCPETQFILDHIAKPNVRGEEMEPWASQISDLASLPNVVCKVSGVLTEADHDNWSIDEVRPYVEHVLAAFGEDRVVFGSDWPVLTQAASYRTWVETLDALTADWSDSAKAKLWRENGRRFYRIAD